MKQITKDDTAELERVFRLVDNVRKEIGYISAILDLYGLSPDVLLPNALDNARYRMAMARRDLDDAVKNSIPF